MIIGGGVYSQGCLQEEIRFCINPDLLVSRLFTEEMGDNECIFIKGSERFSNYTGYGSTFTWSGDYNDCIKMDNLNRRMTEIVALDAYNFGMNHLTQYSEELVLRELNKAYTGFFHPLNVNPTPIATGNWGCGAFGGDKQLKSIIQLLAASQTQRDIYYYTFDDDNFANELKSIYEILTQYNATIGDIYKSIEEYKKLREKSYSNFTLFYYLKARFT